MHKICSLFWAFTISAGISAPASAQMFDGFLTAPGVGVLDTLRRNDILWEPPAKRNESRTGGSTQSPPTSDASPVALHFIPSLAGRRRNLEKFVASTRKSSPENATAMERLFSSTDVFAAFERGLAPAGLRIDNVADVYAVYWITAWETAQGITGSQTDRDQAQGVKAQVSRALLASPDFIGATAAQKQELAEALLVEAALISALAEGAVGDSSKMRALGAAVRKGATAMGLDLDAMRLSATSFVFVK